jgi:mercuric ion binding protein
MKTVRIFSLFIIAMAIMGHGFAQQAKTETFKVSGECSMCKKKIEKAAKDAGASYAMWNVQTKILKVTYDSISTNTSNIQQHIAGVGYDTPKYKAPDDAYHKLDACCQYKREKTVTH